MPKPSGLSITLSPFRRPTLECAPVDAKASCNYPNNARALIEAHQRGFDNCLMRDMLGAIAELGNANVFHGQERHRLHASTEWHLPRWHHPATRYCVYCAKLTSAWSRKRLSMPTSNRPMRFSRPAISRKSCRSQKSTNGCSSPGPSSKRRASFIGPSRTRLGARLRLLTDVRQARRWRYGIDIDLEMDDRGHA